MTVLIDVFYTSQTGPVLSNGIKFSTQSPQGSIKLTLEGPQSDLQKQLQEIRQDIKQNQSETTKCQSMNRDDFFDACNLLGGKVEGSEEEKETFLKAIGLDKKIMDLTEVYRDDSGAEMWVMAFFRDSKSYYKLEIVRTWPGYEY